MTTKINYHGITSWEKRFSKNFADPKLATTGPYINNAGYVIYGVTKTGVDNPKWREQIRRGANATTNYTVDATELFVLSGCYGNYTFYDGGGRTYVRAFSGHPQDISLGNALPNPGLIDTSVADLLARQRFISDYRSKRTKFQSGVFLGEFVKTVQMISSPAKALRKGIDSYYRTVKKRLKKSKPKGRRKDDLELRKRIIQDTWLEYVYGWRPLTRDILDASNLAASSPDEVYQDLRGGAKITASNVHDQHRNAHFHVGYLAKTEGYVVVAYKGAIRASVTPPPFSEQLGLSWSNVLPTAWELIPYSFLVDYFTNIGAIIEAISTGPIDLAWGCKIVYSSYERELFSLGMDEDDVLASAPGGWARYDYYGAIAGLLSRRVYHYRAPADKVSVGIGDFRFRLPGSNTRWLNIAALAKLTS
jgi:hypothetical protein